MKACRIVCLLGALLGLSGCPGPDCAVSGGPPSSSAQDMSIVLVGESVRLRVSPQLPVSCDASSSVQVPSPETVSVEVSGPDNLPVDSQAKLGSPSTDSATISFTPTKQGRYHVFAAFDPVGGIQQFDLYAALDRSAEAPQQTLPQKCSALERTQRGGWLCDTDFLRDGTFVQRFSNSRLAAAGNVVWAVSPTQIQRYVDTGSTLDFSANLATPLGGALSMLASADELVTLRDGYIERVIFDGTQLVVTGRTAWVNGSAPISQPSLKALLLRMGDQLALVSGTTSSGFTVLQVCPYTLQSGSFVRTGAACQLFSAEVMGFEPSAVWIGSRLSVLDIFNDVRRLEWTGTALVDQGSLPLGDSFKVISSSLELRNTATPVIAPSFPNINPRSRATVPVYSADRGILLEQLDPDIQEPSASPTFLWGTPPSSTSLRVRTRPSTP